VATKLDPSERQALRHAVLAFLAERPAVAHGADVITQRLNAQPGRLDFRPSEPDVVDALSVLVSMSLLREQHDPLGAQKYFQATHAGVLAHERGE
jgi:DNA-binding PadR family transcriptional regulator